MQDWKDIKVGQTYRIRNAYGKELDRTVINVTEKRLVYQRDEVEAGEFSDIETKRFISYYNQMGIPYDPQFSGDWVAAWLDPDFEFDDEDGQLAMF